MTRNARITDDTRREGTARRRWPAVAACAALLGAVSATAEAGSIRREELPAPAAVVVTGERSYRADPAALAACASVGAPALRALSVGVDQAPSISPQVYPGVRNELRLYGATLLARGIATTTLLNPSHERLAAGLGQLLAQSRCGDKVLLHFSVIGWVHEGGPWVIYLPEAAETRGARDGRPVRLLSGVVTGGELRSAVTALRNQGVDVVVFIDTGQSELAALTALDRSRAVWSSASPDTAGEMLLPGHGRLAVLYSADAQHLPPEADIPLPGGGSVTATAFAVAATSALADPAVRTARHLADAVLRSLGDYYRQRGIAAGDRGYVWPVIELTDPDMALFTASPPSPAPGTASIVVDTPDATRGAVRVPGRLLRVAGHLQPAPPAAQVLVNGTPATVGADGRFSVEATLGPGQRSLSIVAVVAPDLRVITREIPLEAADAVAGSGGIRRRFVLTIAEQAYPRDSGFNPLLTPVGDADALAKLLAERYGFLTELPLDAQTRVSLRLANASRKQILDTLNLLRRQLASDDALLIFYAGHGWRAQNGDVAYWIPVDAEYDNWGSYIQASDITTQLKALAAQHVLLVSDSCYAGALSRGDGGEPAPPPGAAAAQRAAYLESVANRRSRVLISSGADEPVSDGGGDGHSVFARALLTGLARETRPAFTAEELMVEYLKPIVVGNSTQSPQHAPLRASGHEGGDFVFVRGGAGGPAGR